MRGAERVMHKNIAQRSHLARQRLGVFLLADVQAAVFQQHDLAGLHVHAVHPVGHQRHVALHQFAEALGHRLQRVGGLEFALFRPAQMRRHHHRGTSVERHLNARNRGPNARVFGNLARVVLRHVEVGANENAFAGDLAVGTQIGKTDEVHAYLAHGKGKGFTAEMPFFRIVGGAFAQSLAYQLRPTCSGR